MHQPEPLILILGTVISGFSLITALRMLYRKRLIDDTPTLKTIGVFIGQAELKGTAESNHPLESHLTGTRCVQYRWSIHEKWSKQVTETYTDSDGKTRTRTKTRSGWKTIDHGSDSIRFYLKDETGVIRIDPENAEITGKKVLNTTVGRNHPLYYHKAPRHSVSNSDHRRKFTETLIPLHEEIYILGQTRMRNDAIAVEVAYDSEEPLYIISTKPEKQVSKTYGRRYLIYLGLGLAPAILLPQLLTPSLTFIQLLTSVTLYLTAATLGWTWIIYNSLVTLQNNVDEAWSLIDIQLKRRSNLIPNLVEIVEGIQKHETKIHQELARLRSQKHLDPENKQAQGVTQTLYKITEKYPELVSGEHFLSLQQSLEETEQRIALARDYYNEMTNFYNTRLDTVPDKYVAKLARLEPRKLLQAENFKRAPLEMT